MADVNAHNHLPSSVRSVQRGTLALAAGASTTVNVTSYDTGKASISLESGAYIQSATSTTIQIYNTSGSFKSFSWEIVEYY